MGLYGAASPKRHKAFTNNKWAERYNLGKLNMKAFKATCDPARKPTRVYYDKSGKKKTICWNEVS